MREQSLKLVLQGLGVFVTPILMAAGLTALKLLDVLDWSWLAVLSPIWLPLATGFLLLCLFGVVLNVFNTLFPKPPSDVTLVRIRKNSRNW